MSRPKKEYVYSINGEDFYDLESVMTDISEQFEPGETVKIFKGESKTYKHVDFIDVFKLIEDMQQSSYDEAGDWADGYLLDLPESEIESLKRTIVRWFGKNAKQPNFGTILNIKEIEIKVPNV